MPLIVYFGLYLFDQVEFKISPLMRDNHGTADRIVFLVSSLAFVLLLIWGARVRLIITDDGLEARHFFRWKRMPWFNVKKICLCKRTAAVSVHVARGRRKTFLGLMHSSHGFLASTIPEVATRYGVQFFEIENKLARWRKESSKTD